MKSITIVLASLCGLALGLGRPDPLVSTQAGLIRGLRDDNGYTKFLGVPYGKLNGSNVFGAALPHPGFDDIFEAYDASKICVQIDRDLGGFKGTSDCLNINIYVPDTANASSRLPVMVWIHGGGFVEDAPTGPVDGEPLLKNDVIFIHVNYRLGVYGFMCLDIPEVPGNTGLKDQVLAFRWIKENIAAFGGDPNQITAFGESAGSISVIYHLFSPYERLFDKAILQSGVPTMYAGFTDSDRTVPFRIASGLGFNTNDIYEALNYLAQQNPQIVTEIANNLNITKSDHSEQPELKPCIEKTFDGVENIITDYPVNIESTKARTTPLIIGYNNNEFALKLLNVPDDFYDTIFERLFSEGFDINEPQLRKAIEIIKYFYIGDEDYSVKVKTQVTNLGTDFNFFNPVREMEQIFLKNGAGIIYKYLFSYGGNEEEQASKLYFGAMHGDELNYLFGLKQSTPEDRLVTERMAKLWTNFAKYGNPTPTTSDLLPVKWSPITNTTLPCIEIDSDLSLLSRPFHDRMAFWELFYRKYGRYQKWLQGK